MSQLSLLEWPPPGALRRVHVREGARSRKAPTGSREVVSVHPTQVDPTILYWGKLGYDLEDRNEVDTPGRAGKGPTGETHEAYLRQEVAYPSTPTAGSGADGRPEDLGQRASNEQFGRFRGTEVAFCSRPVPPCGWASGLRGRGRLVL